MNAEDPENDLSREVYARFGLAYYLSECVHRGLVNAFAMLPLGAGRVTRPRLHERTRAAEAMTLGTLVTAALPVLPKDLHDSLAAAVERRNYLAHGFWWDRITEMGSIEGMTRLVDELNVAANQFRDLSQSLDAIVLAHMRSVGVTDNQIEEAHREAATSPLPEIPDRPTPKTGERIEMVAAWVVETSAALHTIQLEDASGTMWQVGELGLDWSYLVRAPSWRRFEPLAAKLPARVVARPKNAKPWDYKIHVSTGVLLCVTWSKDQNVPAWKVVPQE